VKGRGHEGERTGRRGGEEGSSSFALRIKKKSAPIDWIDFPRNSFSEQQQVVGQRQYIYI